MDPVRAAEQCSFLAHTFKQKAAGEYRRGRRTLSMQTMATANSLERSAQRITRDVVRGLRQSLADIKRGAQNEDDDYYVGCCGWLRYKWHKREIDRAADTSHVSRRRRAKIRLKRKGLDEDDDSSSDYDDDCSSDLENQIVSGLLDDGLPPSGSTNILRKEHQRDLPQDAL